MGEVSTQFNVFSNFYDKYNFYHLILKHDIVPLVEKPNLKPIYDAVIFVR